MTESTLASSGSITGAGTAIGAHVATAGSTDFADTRISNGHVANVFDFGQQSWVSATGHAEIRQASGAIRSALNTKIAAACFIPTSTIRAAPRDSLGQTGIPIRHSP